MHRKAPASSMCSRSASRNGWRAGGCRQRHSQRNDRHVGSFSEDSTDGTRLIARLSSNSPRPPKGGRGDFFAVGWHFCRYSKEGGDPDADLRRIESLHHGFSCIADACPLRYGLFHRVSFFKMTRKSLAFRRRIETMRTTATECESLTIDAGLETFNRGKTANSRHHIRREVLSISRIRPIIFRLGRFVHDEPEALNSNYFW